MENSGLGVPFQGIFLFSKASRLDLGHTQWWLIPGIRSLKRKADRLTQASAEVKNSWGYIPPIQHVPPWSDA